MEFKKPSNWLKMVYAVKSMEDYVHIVNEIFIDSKFTKCRWYVLEIYTQDVCGRLHSTTAHAIFQYYNKFKCQHVSVMGRLRRIIGL